MPLASASFAPVSTGPKELKGREGDCQDAGGPENGHRVKENKYQQPKDYLKCLRRLPRRLGTHRSCTFH